MSSIRITANTVNEGVRLTVDPAKPFSLSTRGNFGGGTLSLVGRYIMIDGSIQEDVLGTINQPGFMCASIAYHEYFLRLSGATGASIDIALIGNVDFDRIPNFEVGTLSVTNTGSVVFWSGLVGHFSTLSIIPSVLGGSRVIRIEVSNDNVNWSLVRGMDVSNGGIVNDFNGAALRAFQFNIKGFKFVRIRQVSAASGTTTITAVLSREATNTDINVNTGGNPTIVASATGASATRSKVKAAAGTNATLLKASAGKLHSMLLFNNTASPRFLKLHNVASAPTVGTTPVDATIIIPPNGQVNWRSEIGMAFGTGIAYSITTSILETDATATAVDDVVGFMSWI